MIKEINHILDIGITELIARILELIPEEFVVSLSIDIFQDIFQILEVVVISSSSDTCAQSGKTERLFRFIGAPFRFSGTLVKETGSAYSCH